MKIAVAALKKDQTSQIVSQAGRAPYYLIFDEKANLLEVLKNPFSVGGGGAGFGVAKMLADKQIDAAVAEKFGSNMIEALKGRGIKHYEMSGAANEAPGILKGLSEEIS
jgi:predicted Fe-Mo cluster-binding NifX family protein